MVSNKFQIETNPQKIFKHFEDIKILADSERTSLSFWPEPALRDAINRKKLLILIERSCDQKRLAGFLLYSGVFPHAKILIIATVKSFRRQGIGTALLNSLVDDLERHGYLTIRADVAPDLQTALSFYSKNRFRQIRTRQGGLSSQREIIVHARELETESLFVRDTEVGYGIDLGIRRRSIGEAPFFAFDLNVYFDLAKNRAHSLDARKLFGAALAHQVRLGVADEFLKELRRTSLDEQDDPILQLALRLPRMPQAEPTDLMGLREQIHDLIFIQGGTSDAGTDQALSDAAHLAHAALARASAFVTRDGTILGARAEVFESFGIDVITVDELLSLVLPDEMHASAWPLFGHRFVNTKGSVEIVREYMIGQSLSLQLVDEFTSEAKQLAKFTHRVVNRNDEVLACATLIAPQKTDPVCRLIVHSRSNDPDSELYTDHLLDLLLREASATAATSVELECVAGQSTLLRLARARGFVKQTDRSALAKIVLGRPITDTTWGNAIQELRLRTGIQLPPQMPTRDIAESFVIRTNRGASLNVSLRGLEDILGPTLFIRQDRSGVIVPIARAYS